MHDKYQYFCTKLSVRSPRSNIFIPPQEDLIYNWDMHAFLYITELSGIPVLYIVIYPWGDGVSKKVAKPALSAKCERTNIVWNVLMKISHIFHTL